MLLLEQNGPVLNVTLNRPEVRNAFNDELIHSLSEVFSSLDASIRAVIIRGEGKAFCAGGDLEWMRKAASFNEEQNFQDALKLSGLFQCIAGCHAVVIAAVQGAAFGGGCGLVAAADVAIAEHGTKFCFSEVKLGLVAATISPFVIQKIGQGYARYLFTTADVFDADYAHHIGLVHHVVDSEVMPSNINHLVSSVLKNGPLSVSDSKKLAYEGPFDPESCARLLARRRACEEGKEGVSAFLEKRTANYVVEQ